MAVLSRWIGELVDQGDLEPGDFFFAGAYTTYYLCLQTASGRRAAILDSGQQYGGLVQVSGLTSRPVRRLTGDLYAEPTLPEGSSLAVEGNSVARPYGLGLSQDGLVIAISANYHLVLVSLATGELVERADDTVWFNRWRLKWAEHGEEAILFEADSPPDDRHA